MENQMSQKSTFLVGSILLCLLLTGCGGEIEGKVVDKKSKPVQGVKVTVLKTKFTATTNENGEYKIDYVPGVLQVNFQHSPCYGEKSVELNISKKMKYPMEDIVLGSRVGKISDAISKRDFEAAKKMIKCFPDEVKPYSNYALYFAAVYSDDTDLAQLLLISGADINNSYAPLLAASGSGNGKPRMKMASFLISKGADVNTVNRQGGTAIFSAANYGEHDLVELLFKHGANPNIIDKYNGTALTRASRNGDLKMTKLLVENGADVNLKGKDGRSPLDQSKTDEVKRYLISKGAK